MVHSYSPPSEVSDSSWSQGTFLERCCALLELYYSYSHLAVTVLLRYRDCSRVNRNAERGGSHTYTIASQKQKKWQRYIKTHAWPLQHQEHRILNMAFCSISKMILFTTKSRPRHRGTKMYPNTIISCYFSNQPQVVYIGFNPCRRTRLMLARVVSS